MKPALLSPAVGAVLFLAFGNACGNGEAEQEKLEANLELSQTTVVEVRCDYARGPEGQVRQLKVHGRTPMGPAPAVKPMLDESDHTTMRDNPEPRDAERFIRAASGVRILEGGTPGSTSDKRNLRLAIAQDSRRAIGIVAFDVTLESLLQESPNLGSGSPAISTIPVDSAANISKYDDNARDYLSYRKKVKTDYEAMTTLPSGEILVLPSGSDMLKTKAESPSFRSTAVVLDAAAASAPRNVNVQAFYVQLAANRNIIGPDTPTGPPELNIEGVAVRPGPQGRPVLSLFHRGNINVNGYNSVVDFDYAEWRAAFDKAAEKQGDLAEVWARVKPTRIVRLLTPTVAAPDDATKKAFPIAINDALFGRLNGEPTFFVPAAVEAEFVDANGEHHDGVVTFAGMLRWRNVDATGGGSCEIFQMPGDPAVGEPSRFGKVEGLAAWQPKGATPFERSLYGDGAVVVGVIDVDSEVKSSSVSILDISGRD